MEIISKKPLKPGEKPSCHEIPPAAMRGKPGPQGAAATIEVAGVYTIEPTDPARVENIGDENAAKFEFYIPKGDPGNNGRDYVLTPEDKREIADMIEVPDGPGSPEVEIPTALPNPYPVVINGQEYDGSERVEISIDGGNAEVEIPDALPNPQPITINGVQYDGSEQVEIEIELEIDSGYVLPEPGNYGRLFILLPGGGE